MNFFQEIEQLHVKNIAGNSEFGYIFVVDLLYPQHLHNYHNDSPFCPECIESPASSSKTEKIIPNLREKTIIT